MAAPASRFDTRHRNRDGFSGRCEDRYIQDPVLLSSGYFFTVDKECGLVAGIFEADIRYGPRFRDFANFYTGIRHCLVECQVIRRSFNRPNQREQGQLTVGSRLVQADVA